MQLDRRRSHAAILLFCISLFSLAFVAYGLSAFQAFQRMQSLSVGQRTYSIWSIERHANKAEHIEQRADELNRLISKREARKNELAEQTAAIYNKKSAMEDALRAESPSPKYRILISIARAAAA